MLAGLGAEGGGGRGGEAGGGGGARALNTVEHWAHWGAPEEEQQGAGEQYRHPPLPRYASMCHFNLSTSSISKSHWLQGRI